jgi:hypothetical protein
MLSAGSGGCAAELVDASAVEAVGARAAALVGLSGCRYEAWSRLEPAAMESRT